MYFSFNFDFGESPIISQKKIILLVYIFLFLGWTELLPQGCWIWDWNFGWILLTKKACLEGFFFAPCSSPFSCFPCPLLFWPVGLHSQPMTPHDWPRGGMGTGQKLAGIGLDWDYNITDTMDHVKTYFGLFLTC